MPKREHRALLLFLALWVLLVAACAPTETGSGEDTPDGDRETDLEPEDGDQDTDDESGLYAHDFSCPPAVCRDGFMPLPDCMVPDLDRMQEGLQHTTCTEDADCKEGETCIYATPEWICVASGLPSWLGFYEFGEACAFDSVSEVTTECPLVGAWVSGGESVWIEQCPDQNVARLCGRQGCELTLSMTSVTLVATEECPDVVAGTLLMVRQEDRWPPAQIVYLHNTTGLEEIGRLEEASSYIIDNGTGGGFVCTGSDLIWVTPTRLLRYELGTFVRLLPLASLDSAFPGSQVTNGAFDGVRVDSLDSSLLHVGVAAPYAVYLVTWQLGEGGIWKASFETDNRGTRALPTGDGRWLIGSGRNYFSTRRGLSLNTWFSLTENEWVIGLDARGGALSRTQTRLFRRTLDSPAVMSAIDTGLLFPADYKQYIPSIRHVFHGVLEGEDRMSVVLQYRPAGDRF